MRMRRARLGTALVALALAATACGDDGDTDGATDEGADGGTTAGGCTVDDLPLVAPGTLTVATGEPVFEPWMVDDDPANQQGFESALVYAVADELGFSADQVSWVRTGFDEAIAPGSKDYDFNVQQYSITADRDEVVDFSTGYYQVEQALVGASDSTVAQAASLADLADDRLGAAIGTTSLDYIEDNIQPDRDGLVFDLPTAYFITAVEIPDAAIVGVLPRVGAEPEELGFLFEEGSELVPCVDEALAALRDAGTIDALEDEWLNQGGSIPTLER